MFFYSCYIFETKFFYRAQDDLKLNPPASNLQLWELQMYTYHIYIKHIYICTFKDYLYIKVKPYWILEETQSMGLFFSRTGGNKLSS